MPFQFSKAILGAKLSNADINSVFEKANQKYPPCCPKFTAEVAKMSRFPSLEGAAASILLKKANICPSKEEYSNTKLAQIASLQSEIARIESEKAEALQNIDVQSEETRTEYDLAETYYDGLIQSKLAEIAAKEKELELHMQ